MIPLCLSISKPISVTNVAVLLSISNLWRNNGTIECSSHLYLSIKSQTRKVSTPYSYITKTFSFTLITRTYVKGIAPQIGN